MSILKIEKLYKKFPKTVALKNVSMYLTPGRCYGVLGPNGSGKSTLFRLIAGLERPSKGKIEIFGEKPGYETKRKLAYLGEGDTVYPWMKTHDVIRFYGSLYPFWNHGLAQNLVEFLEIPRNKRFSELSKGFRARVKLLILFSSGAELLLLDDPLSGIDPASREKIVKTLYNFWNPTHQTLLVSTHIISEIETIFDYVYFLSKGEIVLKGEADDLRKRYKKSMDEIAREVL